MDPVVAAILRTVYGSCGAIELAAEDALVDFLTERGGQVHTEELRPLYNQLPWLKLAVGQLSVFCNASLLLDYAPAECDTPVVRLIAAAASKTQCCVGAESVCGGDAAEKHADAAPLLLSPAGQPKQAAHFQEKRALDCVGAQQRAVARVTPTSARQYLPLPRAPVRQCL